METKKIIRLIVALALIAIVAIFFLGQWKEQPEEPPDPLSSPQATLLLSYIDRMGKADDYALSYEETNDMEKSIELVNKGSDRLITTKTVVDEKKVYRIDGEHYLCVKVAGEDEHCALLENSSTLISYAFRTDGQFLDAKSALKRRENSELLISRGAVTFHGDVEEKEVNNITCSFISYGVDYGKLSIDELREIGLSPADPAVAVFSNYTISLCINNDTGVPVETEMSYVYMGKTLLFRRALLSFSFPSGREIAPPSNLTNESTLEYRYGLAEEYVDGIRECNKLEGKEKDSCYSTMAITKDMDHICDEIASETKRDMCLIALVTEEEDISLCDRATKLKDECFAEAAVRFGDRELCDMVGNETLREQCISAIEEE